MLDTGFHNASIRAVSFDASGEIVLSVSDDKTVRLYRAGGSLIRVIRVPADIGNEGNLSSGVLSPDGQKAWVAGWTGLNFEGTTSVYEFETRTGSLVRRFTGLPSTVTGLAVSPDGRFLAVGLFQGGLRVFDTKSGGSVGPTGSVDWGTSGLAFAPDGRLLVAAASDGRVLLYPMGAGLGSPTNVELQGRFRPSKVAFSVDGGLLAIGALDKPFVEVLRLEGGRLQRGWIPDLKGTEDPDLRGGLFAVGFLGDGRLVAGGGYGPSGMCPLVVWADGGRGQRSESDVGFANSLVEIQRGPEGGLLIGGHGPLLVRLDATLKPIWKQGSQTGDLRDKGTGFRTDFTGQILSFSLKYQGAEPLGFRLQERVIARPREALPAPDTTSLAVKNWKNEKNPSVGEVSLTSTLSRNETARSLAIAPDRTTFALGADWNLYHFTANGKKLWSVPLPGGATGLAVSGDGRLIVAALGDGTIRWYRLDNGRLLLSLFPHVDKKRWVLWTPSGYYDASPGGEDLLGWHINRGVEQAADFYPAGQFRSRFYRPDVVGLVLETLDESMALVKANETLGRKEVATSLKTVLPPVVEILSPADGTVLAGNSVTMRYRVRNSSGEPLTAVRFLVDGRPLSEARGLKATGADGERTETLTIPEGNVTVSIIAENRLGGSVPATVRLTSSEKAEFVVKPKLYVLAVGVSQYDQKDLVLNFAAKDARDFANAMKSQEGRLYRSVEVRVLTDQNATRDEILDGLEWVQRQTTSRDVAAVFFAGHGVNDVTGIYYYLPVGADPERLKRTGLPYTDVVTTIRSIPGKALFFLDTCHSGNIMGGRRGVSDINAVVNELSSSDNGAVVFTASTGSQYSLEDKAWQNGAFTKALVEGLSGGADYQNNGRITLKMLDLFISERVKELTRGAQSPTTIIPASVPDFPVAMH